MTPDGTVRVRRYIRGCLGSDEEFADPYGGWKCEFSTPFEKESLLDGGVQHLVRCLRVPFNGQATYFNDLEYSKASGCGRSVENYGRLWNLQSKFEWEHKTFADWTKQTSSSGDDSSGQLPSPSSLLFIVFGAAGLFSLHQRKVQKRS